MIEKGQLIEITITDMSNEGKGIGRVSGLAVFVDGSVVGDTVRAEITKVKKRYAFAKTVEVISASADRVDDECAYSGRCGGCSLRSISYDAQLRLKRTQVFDKLTRIGELSDPVVHETIASPERDRYRNKTVFAVEKGPSVGFHRRGSSSNVIDCVDCLIQPEVSMAVADAVRKYIREKSVSVYDEKTGKGLLRKVTVKIAKGTGQVMVVLTVNGKELPASDDLVMMLDDAVNSVASEENDCYLQSVIVNTNINKDMNIISNKCEVLAGTPTITDQVFLRGAMSFEISALAFYQVNTEQMRALYAKAADYAALEGGETLLDLYCGIGTIGLSMAGSAGMVIGIEEVKPAVLDANRNAVINGIVNARYYTGKAEAVLPKLFDEEDKLYADYIDSSRPKIAVLDPPRSGCEESLLETVACSGVDRIVYISCDPGTLARDVKKLCELGYEFVEATPFDMFPMTMHVETVVLMSKKDT